MHCFTFKSSLGYQEKRAAVKVQVKEMRAFNHIAESCPWPALTAPFIFQEQMLIFQAHLKPIFKGCCLFVDGIRKYEPKSDHQSKP